MAFERDTPMSSLINSAIKSFFRVEGPLDKAFLGFFLLTGVFAYYHALVQDCSSKNCGGFSGVSFWFAINFFLLLAHFVFWMRNGSKEFSRFFLFRAFCVVLSLVMYLTIIFGLIPDFYYGK